MGLCLNKGTFLGSGRMLLGAKWDRNLIIHIRTAVFSMFCETAHKSAKTRTWPSRKLDVDTTQRVSPPGPTLTHRMQTSNTQTPTTPITYGSSLKGTLQLVAIHYPSKEPYDRTFQYPWVMLESLSAEAKEARNSTNSGAWHGRHRTLEEVASKFGDFWI